MTANGRRPEWHWPVYRLYGLTLRSDFPFRNRLPRSDAPPDVTFRCSAPPPGVAPEPVEERLWPVSSPGPEPPISLHRGDRGPVLRFAHTSTFALLPTRIECTLLRPEDTYLVEIQLLGMVLALWLEQRGVPVLHASAVDLGGRTVAFVGPKGSGKTSLAAAFLQGGHLLVTEDLLALEREGAGFRGHPGYPQLRFWPDQARHFLPGLRGLEIVHPDFAKLRAPVGPGGLGSMSASSSPVDALYLLERRSEGGDRGIRIWPLGQAEATIELIRHSFLPELVQALRLAPRRLGSLAQVASRVPMRRLDYPGGLGRLGAVRDAVIDDLDERAVPAVQ